MAAYELIHRLIREGKLPEPEGLGLLEAFETAEARDQVIREELSQAHASRRRNQLWAVLAFGLYVVALSSLITAAVIAPTRHRDAAGQWIQQAQQLLGQHLDLVITTLEYKLRQPGNTLDYRVLGMAYEKRYEQSHADTDRQRAAEAFARAERLERRTAMKGTPAVFGFLFVLVVITAIVLWIMVMYNGLAKSDERVNERWAQVEAVLQRRLDMVPQLVETVKGYATHERETLVGVTEARAKALGILQGTSGAAPKSAQTIKALVHAQQDLMSGLKKLVALAEQYPELKANSNFLVLQDQLEGTENRIAVERQRYNDAVRAYNAKLRVFPSNVVGGMFGYEPREYFESALGADKAVPVSF